jgi:hypothetical protein
MRVQPPQRYQPQTLDSEQERLVQLPGEYGDDEAEGGAREGGGMPGHHHHVFVAIFMLVGMAMQILFIAEVRVDSVMEGQCSAGLWVLVLVRFIVFALVAGADLVPRWCMAFECHGLVHITLHLVFAIAMTVVLATMPGAGGGCSRALETAATVTHSYALLVVAWLAVVMDWIGFVSRLLALCRTFSLVDGVA